MPQLLHLSATVWNSTATLPIIDLLRQTFEFDDDLDPSPGSVLGTRDRRYDKDAEYLGDLQPGPVCQLLWQGPRCVLRHAVLEVPADAQLVISGSRTDLTLQDMQIAGAHCRVGL